MSRFPNLDGTQYDPDNDWDPLWDEDDCEECGGEGVILNDCFEDTCCCADPEEEHGYRDCPLCQPHGNEDEEA